MLKLKKHCIRSFYPHCKGKTEEEIVRTITDYIKYHKSSYAVYESFSYQKSGKLIDVSFELLKYVGLGNYISIGIGFKIMLGIRGREPIGSRAQSSVPIDLRVLSRDKKKQVSVRFALDRHRGYS